MSLLIDTNVLSELRKGSRTDPAVRAWFDETDERSLFTSVLVLGEVRRGIESIRRRDSLAAEALDQERLVDRDDLRDVDDGRPRQAGGPRR